MNQEQSKNMIIQISIVCWMLVVLAWYMYQLSPLWLPMLHGLLRRYGTS